MAVSREILVDRRFKEWEARRNRKAKLPTKQKRIITLTGRFGAMGDTVAARVAEILDYTLYDRKLISMIAERAQVDPSLVRSVEEREHTYLREVFDELVGNVELGDTEYAKRLAEVIGLVSANGDAVVLGRGANYLLGPKRALRVYLTAPRDRRLARIADGLKLGAEDADRTMQEEDERRQHWVQSMVGANIRDPAGYDMVICTGTISPEQAAQAIVAAFGEA
jgi:cytidylate kinase